MEKELDFTFLEEQLESWETWELIARFNDLLPSVVILGGTKEDGNIDMVNRIMEFRLVMKELISLKRGTAIKVVSFGEMEALRKLNL